MPSHTGIKHFIRIDLKKKSVWMKNLCAAHAWIVSNIITLNRAIWTTAVARGKSRWLFTNSRSRSAQRACSAARRRRRAASQPVTGKLRGVRERYSVSCAVHVFASVTRLRIICARECTYNIYTLFVSIRYLKCDSINFTIVFIQLNVNNLFWILVVFSYTFIE